MVLFLARCTCKAYLHTVNCMTLVCWLSCFSFNFINLIPTDLSLWSIFPFLSLCVALCGAEVREVGYKCGVKLLDWSSSSGTCWRTVAGSWHQGCWYLVQLKLGAAWRSYDKQIFSYHRSPQWNLGVPVNLACEPFRRLGREHARR